MCKDNVKTEKKLNYINSKKSTGAYHCIDHQLVARCTAK